MGTKHSRDLAFDFCRPIQISGHVMPRITGKEDLLDSVITTVDFAVNNWLQGRFGRHGPQTGAHQHPRSDRIRLLLPTLFCRSRDPRMIGVVQ